MNFRRIALTGLMGSAVLTAAIAGCDAKPPVVITDEASVPHPPPLSGGTLVVTQDGLHAIASDPDLDRVLLFDLSAREFAAELPLARGDEPGRVVEGPQGYAYVALRRGGAVVTVDLKSRSLTRRDVCAAPRGMAYDADAQELHVACATGELVTLPALEGEPTRTLRIGLDLRDVAIQGNQLLVSRFKSAEIVVVDPSAGERGRLRPPEYEHPSTQVQWEPAVAWRMIELPKPTGGVAVVHQRGQVDPVGGVGTSTMAYYGDTCDQAILHTAVSVFAAAPADDEEEPLPVLPPVVGVGGIGTHVVLPVDMAINPAGEMLAIAGAGSENVVQTTLDMVRSDDVIDLCNPYDQLTTAVSGEPMAVDYGPGSLGSGDLLYVQTRQPAALHIIQGASQVAEITIPGRRQRHVGHAMFHRRPTEFSGIACASCHPEGGEDGRTWVFDTIGARRTQTVAGGIMETAPFHWSGDLYDLKSLMHDVFVSRMGGAMPADDRLEDLGAWMNRIQHLPSHTNATTESVERGEALFHDSAVACADCHAGPALTDNSTVFVGTGEALQVPSLRGIQHRAPFMHTGCAATLRDRFDPECGGGDEHGKTSHLSEAQLSDLVAYLETL